MKPLEGIYVVLLSAYRNGGIDEAAMRHMVDHYIDAGVHGLVVLGSNGENPYLTDREKLQLIDIVTGHAAGRIPVIVGTGCMGTDATVELTAYARDAGAVAALVAMPQYFQTDFTRVMRHYARVAGESGLPILYYNFPDTTHLKLTPAEIAELATIDGVVGAKETIPDVDEIAELAELTADLHFSVLSGTVLNLAAVMPRGVRGAIGVLPNIVPRECVAFYTALKDADEVASSALMSELFKYLPLLTMNPTHQGILKETLRQMGHPILPDVKDPLPAVTEDERNAIGRVLAEVGSKEN